MSKPLDYYDWLDANDNDEDNDGTYDAWLSYVESCKIKAETERGEKMQAKLAFYED